MKLNENVCFWGILFFVITTGVSSQNNEPALVSSLSIMDVIESGLKQNYSIKQEKLQVDSAAGFLRQMKGAFDLTLKTSLYTSRSKKNMLNSSSATKTLDIEAIQPFANGYNLTLKASDRFIDDISRFPAPINFSDVGLNLSLPLTKRGGKTAVYGSILAAKFSFNKEKQSLKFTVFDTVSRLLAAYWEYVASILILEERKKAEERAVKLLADTEELILYDELPQSERIQYQGNLAAKRSSRVAQEQVVYESRLSLGKLMGMPMEDAENLSAPKELFPDYSVLRIRQDAEILGIVIRDSLSKRSDLLAVRNDCESAAALLAAATAISSPGLTFQLDVGYNGGAVGAEASDFFKAFVSDVTGPNFSVGLGYVWSVVNNANIGNIIQKQSLYNSVLNKERELHQEVKKEIMSTVRYISVLLQQLSFTRQSVENYRQAIENERIKYMRNMSTQINILLIEDRFIESVINEIELKKRLSIAIVNILHSTGLLGKFDDDRYLVTLDEILDLPKILKETETR